MRNRFRGLPSVLAYVGTLLWLFGPLLLAPVAVGALYGEQRQLAAGVWPFVVPAAASFVAGLALRHMWCWAAPLLRLLQRGRLGQDDGFLAACARTRHLQPLTVRHSAFVCALGWVVISAVGAVPYTMALGTGYLDAYFESMSGFTTTGITMLAGLDEMPRGVLFWRSLTQWIGGLGILSFFLFVTYAGSSGPMLLAAESHKISAKRPAPGLFHTLRILWAIYAGATLLIVGLLVVAGTSVFDGVCHAFTALSTGGYSPYDASIGHYRAAGFRWAWLIEYAIVLGMLIGGMNFLVHYRVVRRQVSALWDHFEVRVFWTIVAGALLLVFANHVQANPADRGEGAFRASLFQVVSILTTTGFATEDIADRVYFPAVARQVFLVLMVIGGCIGSTGGGIKVLRIGVLFKMIGRQVRRITGPRSVVRPLVVDRVVVDAEGIRQVAGLFFGWVTLLMAEGDRNTVPFLNLDADAYRDYAAGRSASWPCMEREEAPEGVLLKHARDRDVLCLASGGGRQSAEAGLLGARVAVLDLCAGQLEADRRAAGHYGYEVRTVQGDMRDLSVFADASFDNVLQGISLTFVDDLRQVYPEVWRVLRPGGLYAVAHCNPATYPVCFEGGNNGWDGVGYRIAEPYCGGPILKDADGRENMTVGQPIGEHRHLLRDIFNGLIDAGFQIRRVWDHQWHELFDVLPNPGTPDHERAFEAYFSVLAQKVGPGSGTL
jgi:trk system potassium uptake protein TrkH